MPTRSQMDLPPPKSWQEFEEIVKDAYSAKWGTDLQMNGRSGQKQDGVDIYGPDNIGRMVAIQCKRHSTELTLSLIEKELAKSEDFKGHITTLYIATIQQPDQKIQRQVRSLSQTRSTEGKSAVSILFWPDIVSALAITPNVWLLHYPNIKIPEYSNVTSTDKQLASLNLGYYGVKISSLYELIFSEAGHFGNEDHDQFFLALEIVKSNAYRLLNEEQFEPISHAISLIHDIFRNNGPWEHVDALGKRIATRVRHIDSLLLHSEAKFSRIAVKLSYLDIRNSEVPQDKAQNILKMIEGAFSHHELDTIHPLFDPNTIKRLDYKWPFRVFTEIENIVFDR